MPQFFTGQARDPRLAQAFGALDSVANRTRSLEAADAGQNFDPSFDLRNPYYQDLYRRNGDPFAETDGMKQQRKIVGAIQQQQAEDYDLEYNQPRRAEMEGDIKRDEAVRGARNEANIYFDPDVTRRRETEQDRELELYTRRYVDPRIAEAEGKQRAAEEAARAAIQAAEYRKQGITGAAQIAADAQIARQALKGFSDVGAQRGLSDPNSLRGTQGELEARLPGVDYGGKTEDVAAAADMIVKRYPGRNAQQLRALIPTLFDSGQIGESEMWLLEQEIERRTGRR